MTASALLVTPEAPYPLAGGGALRTASLVEYLARRYHTDVIVFSERGAPDPRKQFPAGLVRSVSVIELPRHSRATAARALRNAVRMARRVPPLVDRFARCGAAVAAAIGSRSYDLGVVEHLWCAPYLDQLHESCARTVLDLHNVESVLHARCAAAEGGVAGFVHRVFARASLDVERRWLPRYGQVLVTSDDDADAARAIAPGARIAVYPNAIPECPLPPRREEEVIVFSGNFEYAPNRTAVRFFAREIWPRLRTQWPALVWRLVGKNAHAVAAFTEQDPRIECTGPVEDALAELARARVAVAPLLSGSGTRLKILEAWAAGTPVVSTPLGAEGLGARDGEHLLLAGGAAGFASAVSRLLACTNTRSSLASGGRLLLEKEFTWAAAWRKLDF